MFLTLTQHLSPQESNITGIDSEYKMCASEESGILYPGTSAPKRYLKGKRCCFVAANPYQNLKQNCISVACWDANISAAWPVILDIGQTDRH